MIIRGGRVFIMRNDALPIVTISNADVILELTSAEATEGLEDFINARVGSGSLLTHCNIMTWDFWSEQEAKENIVKVGLPRRIRTRTIMQRIRKFFRIEAAS